MAQKQKVNKVYLNLARTPVGNTAVAIPATVGGAARALISYNVTQQTSSTAAGDRFGRFLRDFAGVGAIDPEPTRAARAIATLVDIEFGTATAGSNAGGAAVFVAYNYMLYGSAPDAALGIINPIDTRHFFLRAIVKRAVTISLFAKATMPTSQIHVMRNHSIEV